MEEFKLNVKKGFSACKFDINSIKEENSKLKKEVLDLKAEIKGLKIAIDLIKDLVIKNNSNNDNNNNSNNDNNIENSNNKLKTQIPKIQFKKEIKDPYEALIEFKAKSNKKELLKQKIISMINEKGINLSELKYLFVEHFKYTSKATFYNYLKELELERHIKIERENSKNIVFLYSISNQI